MSEPISPPPLTSPQPDRLLAYLGNGHIGLRVGRIPIVDGLAIVNGFWGGHPKDGIPAYALAPNPLSGDLCLDGRWLSETPGAARFLSQRLDFATGELHSRFAVELDDLRASVDVVTFVSRTDPALVLQELTIHTDRDVPVRVRSSICTIACPGRWLDAGPIPRGQPPTGDAFLEFAGMGREARCGAAIVVEGEVGDRRPGGGDRRVELDEDRGLVSVVVRYSGGGTVRHRRIVALVPDLAHDRPARHAGLLLARGLARGWDELREANRREWTELWRARPMLDAPSGWQERTDASFFYLHSSVSRASLASTGVFGLAHAPDYHFYRGHVMWDIESFAFPPLVLSDPDAARAILRFRARSVPAARANAALHGYAGLMFPWEADFDRGQEATPRWSKTDKDHVSVDVGLAFTRYCEVTGDAVFARLEALPVIAGVAEWLLSRIEWTERGVEIRRVRGPAEAFDPVDNNAFVNLAAITFLRRAAALVRWLGDEPPEAWEAVADQIVVPRDAATGAIVNHDSFRPGERLGETPEAAAAFFPVGYRDRADVEAATLRYALKHQVDRYAGTPMFSALTGVYAAWQGRRSRAAELFERGFAAFFDDPFLAPDEFAADDDRFPQASPMLANLGAFLSSLSLGLPGILPSLDEAAAWPERRVVLPTGWKSIEVERLWIRGRATRLAARHGDAAARLEVGPAWWAPEEGRVTRIRPRREPARSEPGRGARLAPGARAVRAAARGRTSGH